MSRHHYELGEGPAESAPSIGELVAIAACADVTVIDGQTPARFGAETMKDVAGYDAKRRYIGAHGAFGALSAVIFKISVKI